MTATLMTQLVFKLFVSGDDAPSKKAVRQVEALCESFPEGSCSLEVVDVTQRADLAEQDKILVTPTLIKLWPLPICRVLGDFGDQDRLMKLLDLFVPPPQIM